MNQIINIKYSLWLINDEVDLLEFNGGGFLPRLQSVVTNFGEHLVIIIRSALFQNLDGFIKDQLSVAKQCH